MNTHNGNIRFVKSEDYTTMGGLFLARDAINDLKLLEDIREIFSEYPCKKGIPAETKVLSMIMAIVAGAKCLDDLDDARDDAAFREITNGGIAPTTAGEFLRSVDERTVERMENLVPVVAARMNRKICEKFGKKENLFLNIDGTSFEDFGKKKEGVGYNYEKKRVLEGLYAFDEFGICHYSNIRKGGTHSSVGTATIIEEVYRCNGKDTPFCFRGDSAYGNQEIINGILNKNGHFIIALKKNVYGPLLKNNIEWTESKIKFFDDNECYIASTRYTPKDIREPLRVVLIKSKTNHNSDDESDEALLTKDGHRYYAAVTNIDPSEASDEEIIAMYRGRANIENDIKDIKHGMELDTLPCQKMLANRLYGVIVILAMNLLKYLYYMINQKRVTVKTIRKKIINIAGIIIRHARRAILKASKLKEEVLREVYYKIFGYQLGQLRV
jgi:hypothetical protein